jgi:hypothetical protein
VSLAIRSLAIMTLKHLLRILRRLFKILDNGLVLSAGRFFQQKDPPIDSELKKNYQNIEFRFFIPDGFKYHRFICLFDF